MAAGQGQAPTADAFDAYFRAADLDRDGRISGQEAVAFFKGSNLSNEILAQIWSYAAGQNNSGFLGRMEFYNALRLVTVAQSGRGLTPDIVKAALYSPAAVKIPAPKINPTTASSAPQANNMSAQPDLSGNIRPPTSQMNSMATSTLQANTMVTQAAHAGIMRPPASQLHKLSIASSQTNNLVPQHSQTGFMRPPTLPINSLDTSSPRGNMFSQPVQSSFIRPEGSQMNSLSTSAPQTNNVSPLAGQTGFMMPSASQNPGVSGQQIPQYAGISPQVPNLVRPPQAAQVTVPRAVQGFGYGLQTANAMTSTGVQSSKEPALSTDWLTSATSRSLGPTASGGSQGHSISKDGLVDQLVISSSVSSNPLDPAPPSFPSSSKDSKDLVLSGNGLPAKDMFGGDAFSATQMKPNASIPNSSIYNSSIVPAIPGSQASVNQSQPGNVQAIPFLHPTADQMQKPQSLVKQNQQDTTQNTSTLTVSSFPTGPASATQTELPWPKITQSDIRKYIKVFLEVDKDRDGKITGEEARNLFLSWRLPREVLRQVWDLSDQDNDSMLSLREFCVAVYLMERYREGRPLPSVLPNSVRFDQTLILATAQPSTAYGTPAWQPRPVSPAQAVTDLRSRGPSSRMEPSGRTPMPPQSDGASPVVQLKPRVPVLEENFVNQLSDEEQKALKVKLQEATDADNKVQELEKEILDSKQKTELYRSKMQEIVLYKSKCDSRLNEIIERIAADRHEGEHLAKKYEEKYKQTGDVASKLTVDEAIFRDIQEKKLELYNAIVRMELGEKSDGALQERAVQIQNDLDELVKALNERCKQYGLRAKPTSLLELPFGWQPGIQEISADWDEKWDKFDEDDGFTFIKELTLEVENIVAPEKTKPISVLGAKALPKEVPSAETINAGDAVDDDKDAVLISKEESKKDKSLSTGEVSTETELANAQSDHASEKSPPSTPGRSTIESPSQSKFIFSPRANENHREKFTDETTWGATFDNDDTDSVWGFNPIRTKETVYDVSGQDTFYGLGGFSLNPLNTDSPSAASVYGKEQGPFFDSVPSTPMYNSSYSPKFNEGPDDYSFDNFSRFDSFSTHDNLFPSSSSLTRFDSIRSTTESSRDPFARFDSFRSTADAQRDAFARFDSMKSTADPHETLARFDSMKSTSDYRHGFSFDDSDPFGSGPFRTSDSRDPKKSTDHWSSF
ncbi:hypothetical protein AXF42_Ash015489 [Apostasia shenzhenica]|uniref:Uncharacterized protein n=1 Tax=Apostasia shenzhenica TaxID=1088818 RepID=A0A2H9ZSC6_9ASPA|nr:hypothetical protein AXF42_Ash015489 [Apostasia shenzhenica]